jgi:hypothetical protein
MPRILLEEKIAFVQRIADQIGAWNTPIQKILKMEEFARYLHENRGDYITFMRYSRKQGRPNGFFPRIDRMMALCTF